MIFVLYLCHCRIINELEPEKKDTLPGRNPCVEAVEYPVLIIPGNTKYNKNIDQLFTKYITIKHVFYDMSINAHISI